MDPTIVLAGKMCEHGKQHALCVICKGSQICDHDKVRYQCNECAGSTMCPHGKRSVRCIQCGTGSYVCKEHGKPKRKDNCKVCKEIKAKEKLKLLQGIESSTSEGSSEEAEESGQSSSSESLPSSDTSPKRPQKAISVPSSTKAKDKGKPTKKTVSKVSKRTESQNSKTIQPKLSFANAPRSSSSGLSVQQRQSTIAVGLPSETVHVRPRQVPIAKEFVDLNPRPSRISNTSQPTQPSPEKASASMVSFYTNKETSRPCSNDGRSSPNTRLEEYLLPIEPEFESLNPITQEDECDTVSIDTVSIDSDDSDEEGVPK